MRDTLAWLLTAVLGEQMVIRETPDGGGRMGSLCAASLGLATSRTLSWRASTGVTAT